MRAHRCVGFYNVLFERWLRELCSGRIMVKRMVLEEDCSFLLLEDPLGLPVVRTLFCDTPDTP